MTDENNFKGMPLTQAVKTWMEGMNWGDLIEINEDRTASTVATSMTIHEQIYKVFIETLETEPAFDEVEDRHLGFGLIAEPPLVEQLALERRKEALAHCVVVAVAD